MKKVGIAEFEATCIEELKTVHSTGQSLLVTLCEKPIAIIQPYREVPQTRELGKLRGRMAIHGVIVHFGFEKECENDN